MSDLKQRTVTGLLFIAVMIGCILLHEISTLLLFGTIVFFGSLEMSRLLSGERDFISASLQVLFFGMISITLRAYIPFGFAAVAGVISLAIPAIFNPRSGSLSSALLSMALVSIPFGLLTYLPGETDSRFTLLTFFILLWTNDTFAYLSGRKFGKRKLWERLSPKKTWEGFIGGMAAAIIVSLLICSNCGWTMWDSIIVASIVAVAGTLGDLMESALKRKANVKDSGTLMPGHGGILDRFDGVMLSAPLVFIYLWMNGSILLP